MENTAMILKQYLMDGPKPYDEVKAYFAGLGVPRAELKKARQALGTKTINTGNTWLWCLPESEDVQNARI